LKQSESFFIDCSKLLSSLFSKAINEVLDQQRKVSRTLELSVTGQSLLHDHHPEYGYPSPTREEIVRSVFARITWGY